MKKRQTIAGLIATVVAACCLGLTLPAVSQSSIGNPNGYWEVSGDDGTISRLSASPSTTGSVSVTVNVERPGGNKQVHGFRPGDVLSRGTFYTSRQTLVWRANLKPSASPESAIRNLSCDVFLGTAIRGTFTPFSDEKGQPVDGVFRYKRLTPIEEICAAFTYQTGQCRIKKCFEYLTESYFAHITHDTIWTRDRSFAESYAKGITYRGKSYAALQEEVKQDHREYEQENATEALALVGAIFGAAAESYQQKQQAQQQQRWARIQAQGAARELARKQAIADLVVPDAEVCKRYAEKDRYKNYDDVRLAGVGLGMDVLSAHDAMLCNGFTVGPDLLARAGGLTKFLTGRLAVYHRDDPMLGRITAELESRPNRAAPKTTPYNVISARVRYPIAGPLSTSEIDASRRP